MKKKPLSQKIFLYNVALTCIIVLIMIIFSHIHSLDFLNWKIYDVLFNIRRHTPVKRENVVVVCIDQKSLDFVVDNMEIKWPWPREYHAQLVRYLSGCGAKAIVFDIIFSDPDIDRTNASPGENCDADFGHAIEESGMTYLAASFQDSIVQKAMDEKIYLSDTYTFKNIHLHNYETAVFPLPVLSKGAAGLGFVNFTTEKGGMVRRYPLLFKFREKYTPSIGFTIARDFVDNQTHKFMDLEQFENSKLIDKEGMFLLNWYGKGGPEGVFTYYSYHAVLASSLRENGDPPHNTT